MRKAGYLIAEGIVLVALIMAGASTKAHSQSLNTAFAEDDVAVSELIQVSPVSVLSGSLFDPSVLLVGLPERNLPNRSPGSYWLSFEVRANEALETEAGSRLRRIDEQGLPAPAVQLILDSTYFFIARYDIGMEQDSLFIWINPSDDILINSEGRSLSIPPTAKGSNLVSIQFENSDDVQRGYEVQEFRVGESLERVAKGVLPAITGLESFESRQRGEAALLAWRVSSPLPQGRFIVENQIDEDWAAIAVVQRHKGEDSTRFEYLLPKNMPQGARFRLRQEVGTLNAVGPVLEVQREAAPSHRLGLAYPNPFNRNTQFPVWIAETQRVRVSFYDALGREMAILHDGVLAGLQEHVFKIDGSNWPSGIYHYEVQGRYFRQVKRVVLKR